MAARRRRRRRQAGGCSERPVATPQGRRNLAQELGAARALAHLQARRRHRRFAGDHTLTGAQCTLQLRHGGRKLHPEGDRAAVFPVARRNQRHDPGPRAGPVEDRGARGAEGHVAVKCNQRRIPAQHPAFALPRQRFRPPLRVAHDTDRPVPCRKPVNPERRGGGRGDRRVEPHQRHVAADPARRRRPTRAIAGVDHGGVRPPFGDCLAVAKPGPETDLGQRHLTRSHPRQAMRRGQDKIGGDQDPGAIAERAKLKPTHRLEAQKVLA